MRSVTCSGKGILNLTHNSGHYGKRRSLHFSNIIERMNKEIRRRIKVIDIRPSESAAMKIIYLRVDELNEKWSYRVLNGYYYSFAFR